MRNLRTPVFPASILLLFAFGSAAPASASAVALQNATATFSQTSFGGQPVAEAIDGSLSNIDGWAIFEDTTGTTNPQDAVFETVSNISFAGGTSLTFTLHQLFNVDGHNLGRFRLSVTTDARSQFADGLPTGGDVSANWTVLHPLTAVSTGGATLSVLGDESILAAGPNPETSVYTVTASTLVNGITGFRLELLADGSFPDSGPGRYPNGNFVLTEFVVDAQQAIPEPSALILASLPALVLVRRRRRRPTAV